MKRWSILGALVCLSCFWAPERAQAWECSSTGCPVWCELPIAYQIGRLPTGVDEAEAIAEIQRAFGDWEAVECSDLAFSYEGRIPESGATTPLTVEFLDPWDTSMGSVSSTISISTPRWDMEGCIPDAGMFFNDQGFAFRIGGGSGGNVDLYTSVAGALGRAFGLGNSSDPDSVMRGTETGGPAEITADDVEGVCTLYGSGEGLSLCSPCLRDGLCGGDGDLCVDYPDGNGYCGTACTEGGGECAADEACVAVGDAMQCVRMIDGEQQCVAPGVGETCTPCGAGGECAGECLALPEGNYCFSPCESTADCEAGQACVAAGPDQYCVPLVDGEPSCEEAPDLPDAGPTPAPDAGTDGGDGGDGGCGCVVTSPRRSAPTALLFFGALALIARRRRFGRAAPVSGSRRGCARRRRRGRRATGSSRGRAPSSRSR